jgi:hypothetical protein
VADEKHWHGRRTRHQPPLAGVGLTERFFEAIFCHSTLKKIHEFEKHAKATKSLAAPIQNAKKPLAVAKGALMRLL